MGTLGFGFPTALGAKVARPDRPRGVATGDGGFLFAATELATAVQHGINTITVVYNDNAYGNSNRDQRERFTAARSAPSCATPTSSSSPNRSAPTADAGGATAPTSARPSVDAIGDTVRR